LEEERSGLLLSGRTFATGYTLRLGKAMRRDRAKKTGLPGRPSETVRPDSKSEKIDGFPRFFNEMDAPIRRSNTPYRP